MHSRTCDTHTDLDVTLCTCGSHQRRGRTRRPVRSRTCPYVPARSSQPTGPSGEVLWRVHPRSRRHLRLRRWRGRALSGRQCALVHRTARGRTGRDLRGAHADVERLRPYDVILRVCEVLPWPGDVPPRRPARSLRACSQLVATGAIPAWTNGSTAGEGGGGTLNRVSFGQNDDEWCR